VINQLKANQRGPVTLMDQVSRALPELLWLDNMDVAGATVILHGRAFNTNAVANFIENLDKVPEFQEPILVDAAQSGTTYAFQINFGFTLATPPEAPAAPKPPPPPPGPPPGQQPPSKPGAEAF
jgi:Tfp pilus assembly protein PilN